jgi:pimeloyl-ACP methyl ester carboxylesterase
VSRRRALAVAGLSAAGLAAWEIQRRRDLRAIQNDPEWQELHRPLPSRARDVRSADGTRLHVEIFGRDDAPTIVLIHGWVEAIRLWHYQIRDLMASYRVVAYDQRGHGLSDLPKRGGYTEAALADDLQAVLEACLRPGERCIAAGHSMGGMTMVAWAGRFPSLVADRLAGAALVNTGVSEMLGRSEIFKAPVGHRIRALLTPAVLASPLRAPTIIEPVSLRAIKRVAFAPDASLARVAFCHQMFLTAPAPVRSGFGRMFIPLDLTPAVACLTPPAVVIAGEHDRLLPAWHSEQLAGLLPNAVEHVVLPGTGHMAPIEAPNEVTGRLLRLATSNLTAKEPALAG